MRHENQKNCFDNMQKDLRHWCIIQTPFNETSLEKHVLNTAFINRWEDFHNRRNEVFIHQDIHVAAVPRSTLRENFE